jgi:hypothetical protein
MKRGGEGIDGWRDGGMRDGGRRDVWGSWRAGRLESKKKEIKRDVVIVQSTCEHKLATPQVADPLPPSSTCIEGR